MQRTGQCLCGQIKLTINDDNAELDVCHCKNRQLQSGSAYAPFLAVALDNLSVGGDPKCFSDSKKVSGRTVRRYFCGDCGSPAYVVVERALTTAYVFTGLLDQTSDLRPKVHGWTTTKHAWVEITEGGLQHDMDPGLSPR
ncbi:MAG: GFA family protein [Pseudomonadota bacterium]|nr:GFA family protein [Pseudomonadota bacterium]